MGQNPIWADYNMGQILFGPFTTHVILKLVGQNSTSADKHVDAMLDPCWLPCQMMTWNVWLTPLSNNNV